MPTPSKRRPWSPCIGPTRRLRVWTGSASAALRIAGAACVVLFHAPALHAQPSATGSPVAPAQAGVQAAQPPAPLPVATHPPLPNRVNEVLPSWLRVRGEARGRLEGVTGAGFTDDRDDRYYLNRVRVSATVQPLTDLSFTGQVQDARVAGKSIGSSGPPYRDEIDLRLAYAEIGGLARRATARVGRQELVFGDQRLIGHANWTNTARTFDGARITLRSKPFQLDVFGTSVVNVRDEAFNESDFHAGQFWGAYGATSALVPKATLEPFVLYRLSRNLPSETGGLGDLRSVTVGVRFVGSLPAGFDYNTEMATQAGSLGRDDVRAWAGHWQLRRTFDARRGLRAFGEFNTASGDANPKDGRRGTFDQLFPTGHDKYGLADQVGWRNVHHVRAGGEVLARKRLLVSGAYHTWWLASAHDALYNAAGAPIARVAGGAASTHVGQELDGQAAFPVSPQLQVAAGYAHVYTGAFLKQATPGASFSAPYVMVTYVFLAEK